MDVKSRSASEPGTDFRMLVRAIVVHHQMHIQVGRNVFLEVLKEGQLGELNKPHPTQFRVKFTGDSAAMRDALQQREVTVQTVVSAHHGPDISFLDCCAK